MIVSDHHMFPHTCAYMSAPTAVLLKTFEDNVELDPPYRFASLEAKIEYAKMISKIPMDIEDR